MRQTSETAWRQGRRPARFIAIILNAIVWIAMLAGAEPTAADTPPADYFPIGTYWQPTSTYTTWKARGVNTVVGFAYNNADMELFNQAAVANGLWMIRNPRSNIAADVGQKFLLAYEHTDEPDIHTVSAATLAAEYTQWKAANPSIPVIVNVSGANVIYGYAPLDNNAYKAYFNTADIINNDTYPLNGWGRPNWIDKNFVMTPSSDPSNAGTIPFNAGQAVDKIRALTNGKRQYAYIETSFINAGVNPGPGQRAPTPAEFRGEVWDAIVHGAKGIVYFPQSFPSNNDGTPADVAAEMTKTDALITKMGAILNATGDNSPNYMSLTGGLEGTWRNYNGKLYYLVLNFSHAATNNVKMLLDGATGFSGVNVLDESRQLSLANGVLTDSFAPYQLHVYAASSGVATPAVSTAVPEPTGTAAICLVIATCLGRRRRASR